MADDRVLFTSSDSEIQAIAEEVNKIMNNEFKTSTEVTWESLTSAAKFFIQRCDELSNFSITAGQFDLLKNAMQLVRKSNQELVLLQASYAYAFWFDEQLKRFRGQVPSSALYVYETKKGIPSTYEMPLTSLIRYLNAADKNRLGASKAQLQKELNGVRKEDTFDQEHVSQALAAYTGVSNRLERYWAKTGGQRQSGILLWKENKDWIAATVLNKGDLREAYVAALMTQHKSNLDKLCGVPAGGPQYYSHELIKVFFNEHVSKVSNAAAIQEEDIITPNKQYAVKSFRAELPSLSQYYNAAKWIVENKEPSKEALEEELRKGGEAFRNKIVGHINEEANQTVDDVLNSAMSQFKAKK